jgi:hypothetical protein
MWQAAARPLCQRKLSAAHVQQVDEHVLQRIKRLLIKSALDISQGASTVNGTHQCWLWPFPHYTYGLVAADCEPHIVCFFVLLRPFLKEL